MMQFDMERFRAEMRRGVAQDGLRGYARRLGVDVGAVRSVIDGRDIQASRLLALCEAMGLSLLVESTDDARPGFAEAAAARIEMSVDGSPEALRAGFLPIPFNMADPRHRGAGPVAFARAWLDDQGLAPEGLSFLTVRDARMVPTLRPGMLALIDARAPQTDHAPWAFVAEGQVGFARLSRPAGDGLLLDFDAPGVHPELRSGPVRAALRRLGRVVWAGGVS